MKNQNVKLFIKNLLSSLPLLNGPNTTNNNVKNLSEFCYYHLPKPIKKTVFSILESIFLSKLRFASIIYQFSLSVYSLHGKEKYSGENLTILILARNEKSISYLSSILFSEEPRRKKIEKICICNIRKSLSKIPSNIDAVFIESDRFYSWFLQKHGFIVVPKWISMMLDISGSLENICKKFKDILSYSWRDSKKKNWRC